MIEIPDSFFESKFTQHVPFSKRDSEGNMRGCCPYCNEGNSWGKKKRFHYYADRKYLKCYNCGIHRNQINFLIEQENVNFTDIIKMIRDVGGEFIDTTREWLIPRMEDNEVVISLPDDAINLFDPQQTEFYGDDFYVGKALDTIRDRRLDKAENRGELYLSREDFIHKNRIIIPFRDATGKLEFYQSRAQTSKQNKFGKYISSANGKKTFYGVDKLDMSREHIFVIEGPLDCFFVVNSIGGGGTELNEAQKGYLDELGALNTVVFCLDNDFNNKDVLKHYLRLIEAGECVFFWEGEFAKYKDFNEYCIGKKANIVTPEQILEHTYSGVEARKAYVRKLKEAKIVKFT